LPSNGSQVREDGIVNGNVSGDTMSAVKTSAGDKEALDTLMRLDTLTLSIICVGLVGNTLAFSALSSRGCRGRRRRWRTHHALAILLKVDNHGFLNWNLTNPGFFRFFKNMKS